MLLQPKYQQSRQAIRRLLRGVSCVCPHYRSRLQVCRRWCLLLLGTGRRDVPRRSRHHRWSWSIISPRAPLPLRGFIIAVGRAATKSVSPPQNATHADTPSISISIAPEARNTPTATNIATRYGIILTAVEKPSFAPSINAS